MGIFESFKFAFYFSLLFVPLISFFSVFLNIVLGRVNSGFFGIATSAFVLAVWLSSLMGLNTVFKHVSLRLTLFLMIRIPWNYARFLNHCTDRLLLQRVGGRYRFIHRLVQEHFAAMPLEK